jgi:hypothetical protein
MPAALLGGFLVLHGLITAAIGGSALGRPDAPGLPNTNWLGWPTPLGRSWLIDGLHLERISEPARRTVIVESAGVLAAGVGCSLG